MRRLAAVMVLMIFASLNAIDGICCPDGCTYEEEQSSRPTVPRLLGYSPPLAPRLQFFTP